MLTIPSAVEEALKNGAQKNFRVHFPNGERADITNDNIVSESVSFTESICSQSELKFGLAEASVLEFETVGVENIRGAEIEASVEVEYSENLVVQPFIFGTSYRDDGVYFLANDDNSIYIGRDASATKWTVTCVVKSLNLDSSCRYMLSGCPDNAYIRLIGTCDGESFIDRGSGVIISNKSSVNITIEVDRYFAYHEYATVRPTLINLDEEETYSIPYGKFIVDECPRQTNLEHRKVTAYSQGTQINGWDNIERLKRSTEVPSKLAYEYNPFYASLASNTISNMISALTYGTFQPISSGLGSKYLRNAKLIETGKFVTFRFNGIEKAYDTTSLLYFKGDLVPFADIEAEIREYCTSLSENTIQAIINAVRFAYDNPLAVSSDEYSQGFARSYYNTNDKYMVGGSYAYPYMTRTDSFYYGRCFGLLTSFEITDISHTFTVRTNVQYAEATSDSYFPMISIPRTKIGTNRYICSKTEEFSADECFIASLELLGSFGIRNRNGNFDILSLDEKFNNPCYEIQKSEYSQFWYEENFTAPYGRVCANYTDTSDEEAYTEVVISNEYPSLTYDISDNAIIKNTKLSASDMTAILTDFADKVDNIRYIASDISSVGLPFLEAGDVIDVVAADDNLVRTFVEKRTISGIQALFDDISSEDTRNTYISGGSSSGGSSGGGGGTPSPVVVNDSTITIEQGNYSDSFTLNQSSDKTISLPEADTSNCYKTTDATSTSLANADYVPISKSSGKVKATFTTIKSFLKTYFDTLYSKVTANPSGTATTDLNKITIDGTVYNIPSGGGGGGGLTLLWTNSSPTSNFTPKTVSLSLSNYEFFIVHIKFTSGTDNHGWIIVQKGFLSNQAVIASNYRYRREITFSNTGVTFGSGEGATPGGTSYTTNNGYYIPYAIYGMK